LLSRGWIVIGAAALVACYLLFINAYRFLAITRGGNSDMLVIKGWVHDYAITAGAEEFQTGAYHHLFATGGPVTGQRGYLNDYNAPPSVDAELLKKPAYRPNRCKLFPSHVIGHDRTYSSAVALQD
jgi:hypothetical protein